MIGLAKLGKVCKRSRTRVPRAYMAGVTIKYASPFAALQAVEASRGRRHLAGAASRNEIEGIRHLEYALGMTTVEIAVLVSDIGNDGKTRTLDLLPAGGLEFLSRRLVAGLFQYQVRPSLVADRF